MIQARLVRKLESDKTQSKQTLDTVKSQESVISKLEGLLKQAMAERRAAVATADKVQQQVVALEHTIESNQSQVKQMQTCMQKHCHSSCTVIVLLLLFT